MQVDVALKVDGSGQEPAARHDDAPTAGGMASLDRLTDGVGAVGLAVADGAQRADIERAVREGRLVNPAQDRIRLLPWVWFSDRGVNRPPGPSCQQRSSSGA
jgi:hypothetical protein